MSWKRKQQLRYWLAKEKGTIHKDWGGKIRVALAFPNRYAVGMSNLGFQAVYQRLNAYDDIVCERVFYPEPADIAYHRQNSGKLLSVESQKPVKEFDVVAFSIPFENDYTNVLEMLGFAGISPYGARRNSEDPLITAGGVAVFLNPEPLAPFIDVFFIGEAEALLSDFLAAFRGLRSATRYRHEFLGEMARQCSGLYVPAFYHVTYDEKGRLESVEPRADLPERIVFRRADLTAGPACQSVIITPESEFSNVALIEIGRGCGRGCRFCAAGFVYRPPRFVPAARLIAAIEPQLEQTNRVGLVSAAVSDHPDITELCSRLTAKGAKLTFSSLRADNLNGSVLSALAAGEHHAIAIAPEAGSERLRRVINKHLAATDILQAVEMLADAGILNLKLYFMIGLPSEDFDDLEALVDLTKKIKHHVLKKSRGRKRLGTITLSINGFVPKPFTPFQWVAFAGVQQLKERSKWIKKSLARVPNVRVYFDVAKWAYVQALLARGDRRVAMFLDRVAMKGDSWSQALKQVPHNADFWIMRERDPDESFPWEIIDHGLKRSFLWKEYQKSLEAKESPFCIPDEACRRCGVCSNVRPEHGAEIE